MFETKNIPLYTFMLRLIIIQHRNELIGNLKRRGVSQTRNELLAVTSPLRSDQSFAPNYDGDDELRQLYKPAPFPLSLFDENGMRKNQKSAIYKCFQPANVDLDTSNITYIIDGGYLLHRVVWNKGETFDTIFDTYVHYVHKNYGDNVVIVFDGYNDHQKNIKAAEQRRRCAKVSPSADIVFDGST
ncbi:hypothetical protein RN001_000398 [Aquatica leii]|uniref:Uncharacterized protein n=1 Tax=Aquatica leii TaxID=1421715 RepID=A0AAN7PEU0_9COLE|nr:hypothetical protein RN001_000398 [Aquatica leii]